jgi:mannose-6-phosphate isomerase-like protein (cupin superfamily)
MLMHEERIIPAMLTKIKRALGVTFFITVLATGLPSQSAGNAQTSQQQQRQPTSPSRPFVLLSSQSLSDLERKLRPENKVEDLIGGVGMQLRVAVQHDKSRPTADAEVHDASDDIYYVLDGEATLTLGGRLDAPREAEPGEWRSARITGGQTFVIRKGDLIIVPRGTPHQRTGKDFSMILIKIFAEPVPARQPK